MDDSLLTVLEIANDVRVTPETVRRWLRQQRLEGVRPGGTKMGWRVRQSQLKSFLSEEK